AGSRDRDRGRSGAAHRATDAPVEHHDQLLGHRPGVPIEPGGAPRPADARRVRDLYGAGDPVRELRPPAHDPLGAAVRRVPAAPHRGGGRSRVLAVHHPVRDAGDLHVPGRPAATVGPRGADRVAPPRGGGRARGGPGRLTRSGRAAPGLEVIRLGLRANWRQFALLVVVNAFVGAMVGLERAVLPLLAQAEFGLASRAATLSFLVGFGAVKAAANLAAGGLAERVGRKRILVAGWLAGVPVPLLLIWAPSLAWVVFANVLLGINQGLCWSTTVIMK